MEKTIANHCAIRQAETLNNLFIAAHREAFDTLTDIFKKESISSIRFDLHREIPLDVPSLVFETEGRDGGQSDYSYEKVSELSLNKDGYFVIRGVKSVAYFDEFSADYFDASKVNDIVGSVCQIVAYGDIKEIEKS